MEYRIEQLAQTIGVAVDTIRFYQGKGLLDPPRRDARRVFGSAAFVTGFCIVLFWVGCALFGRALVPYDPFADDMLNALAPPDAEHWFGTDQLGRDVFSRVIAGARDI